MKSISIRLWLLTLIGFLLFPLISHAESLDTWVMRNPSNVPGYSFSAVTCGKVNGNDVFVALAQNKILTSSDGVTWSIQTLDSAYHVFSINYGNGMFVAMGINIVGTTQKPLIMTSTDGVAWIPKTIDTAYNFSSINYSNNTFLAFGYYYNPSVTCASLTSTNGIDWTLTELGSSLTASPQRITYGTQYVAVAGSGILTSSDGVNWTLQYVNYILQDIIYHTVNGNGIYVAVGYDSSNNYNGVILTSPDGNTWTKQPSAASSYSLNRITYGNGAFVAVGGYRYNQSSSTNVYDSVILTSPDGISWTTRTAGTTSKQLSDVAYGANTFVAVGNGAILTSPDGVTWTSRIAGPTDNLADITYGTKWVTVGRPGSITTSIDGLTWTPRTSGTTYLLYGIAYGNGTYVADGYNSVYNSSNQTYTYPSIILTSPDGISWTKRYEGTNNGLNKIIYMNGYFVAVGMNGTILVSPNGTAWQVAFSTTDRNLSGITYGNGLFVAGGDNGTILTSTGPPSWTWQYRMSGTSDTIGRIAYGNGTFVAVGGYLDNQNLSNSRSLILTSTDGITWTPRDPGITGDRLYGISYGGNTFVATSYMGRILTSSDGITWTLRTTIGDPLASVAYNSGAFISVGLYGIILQSGDFLPHPSPSNPQVNPPINTWTADNTIDISWTAGSDMGNGVAGYSFVWDTNPSTEPDNTVETTLNTMTSPPLSDGVYYFHICTVDNSGNKSPTVHWGPFNIDTTPPGNGSVSVNNGSAYATSRNITLNLNSSDIQGITAYFASENSTPPTISTPGWISVAPAANYSDNVPFMLGAGDGQKTVYVWFRDAAGYVSQGINQSVTLDTALPTGSVAINNEAAGTNSRTVTLTLTSADVGAGVTKMGVSNDGTSYAWEDFSSTKSWSLTEGEGTKTVYVKFRDASGNESTQYSASISFDTTFPAPTITFPSSGAMVASLYFIRGTVTDTSPSSGIDKVEIQVTDGTNYLQSNGTWTITPTFFPASGGVTGSDWSHTTLTETWVNGTVYTINARATDKSGNQATASTSFTFSTSTPKAFTSIAIDPSSQTILQTNSLSIAGKLTRLPEVTDTDLTGLAVELIITPPGGADPISLFRPIAEKSGHFQFNNLNVFDQKGTYTIKVSFTGNSVLASCVSDVKTILVGASAGYAILVQGMIASDQQGILSHQKTLDRIYGKLKGKGFVDANIYYFNYDGQHAPPSKTGIQSALADIRGKMNQVAAPLYVIFVDHGSSGTFYLNTQTITPTELNDWLNTLESGLSGDAATEKRIVFIGACYSGSFIPTLSKAGRIIITSAAENEESYKGPIEPPDSVRSGEFFLDELFTQLYQGYSLKKSFEEATRKTKEYTRKGDTSTNAVNKYFDDAIQHPLLDDTGDGQGGDVLVEGSGDGQISSTFFLGIERLTNAAAADIVAVTSVQYLGSSETHTTTPLWLQANDNDEVLSAWVEIRPPSTTLSITGGSGQKTVTADRKFLTLNNSRWELAPADYTFQENGMYEIHYFVRDLQTQAISPMKTSAVYRNKDGNHPPGAFHLLSPKNYAGTKTVIPFDWEDAADPDGNPVTYTLTISENINFSSIAYQKERISSSVSYVDVAAGLKDLTTYYWKVEAVDKYGARTTSTEVWTFQTDNTNGFPGIITGIVYSDRDYSRIVGASISAVVDGQTVTVKTAQDGTFVLAAGQGTVSLNGQDPRYSASSVSSLSVKAGEVVVYNLAMTPGMKGDLNGDRDITIADAIMALQVLARISISVPNQGADVNGDGRIGIAEVIYILQTVAGLRTP